jgi:site-specific recombinase XerD
MPARHRQRSEKRDSRSECISQVSLDHFGEHLRSQGFSANTIQLYLGLAQRFRSWLLRRRKREQPVDEASIAAFVHRRKVKDRLRQVHHIQSGLRHLLRMLRDRGELAAAPAPPPTVIDIALRDFSEHLRDNCGLAESSRRFRVYYVRQFLEGKYGRGPLRLNRLCREDLASSVARFAQRNPGAVQQFATSLRQYLRHLQLLGICDGQLVAAVPTIRKYRLSHLPRTMTEEQLRTFLSSFDRSTPLGRRNYAMALLMSGLGLRVGEVALLQLDDLNWRDGSIRIVSPKTRRTNLLPLPVHVGQAIADYLRHGRPATSHRHVFARHFAPKGIPTNASLIRAAMITAYRRCGFDPRWNGTHILRHTAANQMHQQGATLKEVADLLGHRSIETSAVYAKVNLPALAAVALPWPEVTQ